MRRKRILVTHKYSFENESWPQAVPVFRFTLTVCSSRLKSAKEMVHRAISNPTKDKMMIAPKDGAKRLFPLSVFYST
jgi:hypothetical protein